MTVQVFFDKAFSSITTNPHVTWLKEAGGVLLQSVKCLETNHDACSCKCYTIYKNLNNNEVFILCIISFFCCE